MNTEEKHIQLINYKDLLLKIENKNNHLLIGNGFNYGLGVKTCYPKIFEKMADNNKGIYKDAKSLFKECGSDIETFIGRLEEDISGNKKDTFLKKYVRNKIKLDFMIATHEIAKSKIKNIFAKNNEGVFLLLKNFTNYFTLNYDSFLYLLLLKYKSVDSINDAIVMMPTFDFIENDLNVKDDDIYSVIKRARQDGKIKMDFGKENAFTKDLSKLSKTHFTTEIKTYASNNKLGWKVANIDKVIDNIFEEEKKNQVLKKVDDGSRERTLFGGTKEYVFIENITQNLFFLHGAFHIYKDGLEIKKITKKQDKALYDELENVLNNDKQDIVCVFQSDGKKEAVQSNEYLNNCFNKLKGLSGNLVIIGHSLSENDNYIFDEINKSKIDTLYISVLKKEQDEKEKIALSLFPDKQLYFFDADTISYEMPEENS